MSVPYGQPPAAQPGSTSPPGGGLRLGKILAIVAGGLGLVSYFLSFADVAEPYLRGSHLGLLLLGGGLLAAAVTLPKAPATLVPAAVLVITGTLYLLIEVTNGPAFSLSGGLETPGLVVVILILAFLQSAACVAALLAEADVIKITPRPNRYPQPWGPPHPGGYPGGPPPGGYPGQQLSGSPSGGFSPQPQQPFPQGMQYGQPGQYGGESIQPGEQTRQYSSQPGQYGSQSGHYGSEPGQYGSGPGQYGSGPGQYGSEPGQYGSEPGQYGSEPGQYGTSPGGFGPSDKER